jgi:hypothetical protein
MYETQEEHPPLHPEELLNLPCKVEKLIIHGNSRTKKELIEIELRDALHARTHELLAVELGKARRRLEDLDVFRSSLFEASLYYTLIYDAKLCFRFSRSLLQFFMSVSRILLVV